MEQFSITTGTKAISDALLGKITAEIGDEVAALVEDNSVVLVSDNKEIIIDTISDIIVEQYENKLISKLINQNYFYLNLPDRRQILKKSLEIADGKDEHNLLVKTRLAEYLGTTDRLMLDGFVNFRLKEYQSELADVIDRAVDDFMIEKEYTEFVRLLKYFVEIQPPKYPVVNIVPHDGEYRLYEGGGDDITALCAKEFMREDNGENITSDDILISSLISIAPLNVRIHLIDKINNEEMLSTVNRVFENKVTVCEGCELCSPLR